jgi:hypothetical protein
MAKKTRKAVRTDWTGKIDNRDGTLRIGTANQDRHKERRKYRTDEHTLQRNLTGRRKGGQNMQYRKGGRERKGGKDRQ